MHKVTFEVDATKLFDALHDMKGETAELGARVVAALLTGEAGMIERIGMAFYGVYPSPQLEPEPELYRKVIEYIYGENSNEAIGGWQKMMEGGMTPPLPLEKHLIAQGLAGRRFVDPNPDDTELYPIGHPKNPR